MTNARRFGATLLILSTFGCGDAVGPDGAAHVRVLLTDAPTDYIASAMVDFGAVELLPAGDGDRLTLSEDGTDGFVDLLELQGEVTTLLAEAEIEAGTYREIRLIVESATVTLVDGYTFDDGATTKELEVPSGASSGLKLKLRAAPADDADPDDDEGESSGVEIAAGETTLVLDFDVHRSFRIQGNPETPAGIKGMHFQPTLRVIVDDVAGSVGGSVSTALDGVSVEGLTVTAEPVEDDGEDLPEFQTATATAVTDANGDYVIFFVVPGSYDVTVTPPDGLATNPASVRVDVDPSETVTGVDFEVVSG